MIDTKDNTVGWGSFKSKGKVSDRIRKPEVGKKLALRLIGLPYQIYKMYFQKKWYFLNAESAKRINTKYKDNKDCLPYPLKATFVLYAFDIELNGYCIFEANLKIAQTLKEWKQSTGKNPSSFEDSGPVFIIGKAGSGITTTYSCVADGVHKFGGKDCQDFDAFKEQYKIEKLYPVNSFDEVDHVMSQ